MGVKESLDPEVIFLQLGERRLDFELRMFVKHILTTTRTKSAISFEVGRVFREKGFKFLFHNDIFM